MSYELLFVVLILCFVWVPNAQASLQCERAINLVAKALNWVLEEGEIDPTDKYTQHWTYRLRNVLNNDTFKNIMRESAKQL